MAAAGLPAVLTPQEGRLAASPESPNPAAPTQGIAEGMKTAGAARPEGLASRGPQDLG